MGVKQATRIFVEESLRAELKRLSRKNRGLHEALLAKMKEIASCSDITHYKNLRSPMNAYKRVHVGNFVLLFSFDERTGQLVFHEVAHHDAAYK